MTAWLEKMVRLGSGIQEIYEYQIDPKYVLDKLTELEDRSCVEIT